MFHEKDKTLSAVIWEQNGSKINGGEGWQIQVNFPVLITVSEDPNLHGKLRISLSSPLYPPNRGVTIQIDRSLKCRKALRWQKVEVKGLRVVTSINVVLPVGDQWGSTVTVECMMNAGLGTEL